MSTPTRRRPFTDPPPNPAYARKGRPYSPRTATDVENRSRILLTCIDGLVFDRLVSGGEVPREALEGLVAAALRQDPGVHGLFEPACNLGCLRRPLEKFLAQFCGAATRRRDHLGRRRPRPEQSAPCMG